MPQATLYTIGHSNRTADEFIDLLRQFEIQLLVDIRRFPTSKWEWFKRENLESALALAGVKYIHLGDYLGGYRKGGYAKHMETEEFALGMQRLFELSSRQWTAVMCAEKMAFRCHRRYVAYHMQRRGIRVIHIIDKHRTFEAPPLAV